MKIFENKKKGLTVALVIGVVAFVVFYAIVNIGSISGFFSSAINVLSPIIIGAGLAYTLNPLLRFFEFKVFVKIAKKGVRRALSILCTLLLAAAFLAILLWMFIPELLNAVEQFIGNYDEHITKTANLINEVVRNIVPGDDDFVSKDDINNAILDFLKVSGSVFDFVKDKVIQYASGMFTGVANTVLGIFIAVYMLVSKERLLAQVRKFGNAVLSDSSMARVCKYVSITHKTFLGYFVGKVLGSLCVMFIMLALMSIFKMPYRFLISAIIGVTDIIPIFGPIIGAVPSFFILFIVDPKMAIIFLILIVIVQQIEGNIISPKILGEKTGISSLSVIIAIIIMGEYFGIIGMIIGVPVFAVFITIVKELIETRLQIKGKPIETAEYYHKDDVVDPHKVHVPIVRKLYYKFEHKMFKRKKAKAKKKSLEQEQEVAKADKKPVTVSADKGDGEDKESGEQS